MAINKATMKKVAIGTLIAGATGFGGYKLYESGDLAAAAKKTAADDGKKGDASSGQKLKDSLAARKRFGILWQKEKNAKDSTELCKMVAGYVAAGRQKDVLGLINKNAYVLERPEDYLAVAATLSKSLGEAGVMWFYEDSGMRQKKSRVGAVPGRQSEELTVEAATVYALALSMDNRMDDRFLRLGFAAFTKHLEGRKKVVNGIIALYWGFREAVEISCGTVSLQNAALLAPKVEARASLLRFLSATMKNEEVNEEYRAMAAKLLTFSDDAEMKISAEEYLKGISGKGKRMLELIEKFEANRRANLLDA